jgi:hypothetical protein
MASGSRHAVPAKRPLDDNLSGPARGHSSRIQPHIDAHAQRSLASSGSRTFFGMTVVGRPVGVTLLFAIPDELVR